MFSAVVALAAATPVKEVAQLTKANWLPGLDQAPDSKTLWFVKFYAPWCGHCKRMAPILDEVAAELGSETIRFGKVDSTVETQLSQMYGVHGYPTCYLLRGGKKWEWRGSRSKEGIEAIVAKMLAPPVADVGSPAALGALLAANANGVAFVLARGPGGAAHAAFEEAAVLQQHALSFGATESAEVVAALAAGGGATPPFVAKAERGEAATVLDAKALKEMDGAALAKWAAARKHPRLSLADRHNFFELANNAGRPLVLLLVDPAAARCGDKRECDAGAGLTIHPSLDPAALDAPSAKALGAMKVLSRDAMLQELFTFAVLDGRKWADFAAEHLVTLAQMPRLLVLKDGRGTWYNDANAAGDAASMRAFLDDVTLGNARAEYEGMWGMPDRWWRTASATVPPLAALDVLPRYTVVGALVFAVLNLLIWCLLWEPRETEAVGDAAAKKED